MARVASYDVAALESLIGPRGSTEINSANRAHVQNWLCAQGFPSQWCKGRRIATLAKAYNRPAYLAKLLQLQRDGVLPAVDAPEDDGSISVAPGSLAEAIGPHDGLADSSDAAVLTHRDVCPDCGISRKTVATHGHLSYCKHSTPKREGKKLDSLFSAALAREPAPDAGAITISPESDVRITAMAAAAGVRIAKTRIAEKRDRNIGELTRLAEIDEEGAAPSAESGDDLAISAASQAAKEIKEAAAALTAAALAMVAAGSGAGVSGAPAVISRGDGPLPGTRMVFARDVFEDIGGEMMVPQFTERTQYTPDLDNGYCFDGGTTLAILLGFAHNRRVLISGRHGTGKTSHVEQVAARLNWSFLRLNLDGHISRTDMIGRDAIVLQDGKQVTEFREGILPWAMQQPMALCLDEYDAGRPDVLFVVQRLLETNGALTIAEQNRVVEPNQGFRLFGTANTIGLGDASGLYHGTNALNAAQMDRWNIAVRLDYLPAKHEEAMVAAKCPGLDKKTVRAMVKTATATRALFAANKISTVMSPRTVITWGENAALIGGDMGMAFTLSFLNKCDDAEQEMIRTCYNSAFA